MGCSSSQPASRSPAFVSAMFTVLLPVRLVFAAVCAAVPTIVVKVKRQRRFNKFEELFPEALDLARAPGRDTRSRPA